MGRPLLPGDSGKVNLTIGSPPGNNVNTRVTAIQAQNITGADITGIADPGVANWCADRLIERDLSGLGPIIIDKGQTKGITINNAVTFESAATVACQGMQFKTKWTVTLDATNDAANWGGGAI